MVNRIPTPRHSLRYRSFKKAQFDKQRRDNLKSMTDKPIDFFADEKIAKNIASYIDKTSIGELDLLYLYSDTALENKITSFLPDVASAAKIRFKKTLRQGYIDFLDLGIQHTILDYLYMLPKVKGVLDKSPARFSSFDGTLTDFVLGNSETIAEFNSYDDLTKKEKDAIDRADNELNRLANSLDRLGSNGKPGGSSTIGKYALSRTGRLARMSFEERYRFLIIMQDIDNFKKRAEVSKKNFVADTYLDRRYQVLEEDLTGKYNEYVKQRIASFLKEETRYLSTLKGRGASVEELSRDIQAKLAEYDRKVNKLSKKATQAQTNRTRYGRRAETIIATEVSTAYNFGKLLGFSGPEDLEKRLTWRADWELQSNRSDYEVCKYCSLMDGTSYTVRELLVIGTQLDIGAGGFGKDWPAGGRTGFKNPSLPMIPGHPNCVTPDMQVLCYNNEYKRIDSLKVGDIVIAPTEELFHKISYIHKNKHNDSVYKIRFDNGTESTFTGNHPIRLSSGWVDARDVKAGDIAFEYIEKSNTSLPNVSNYSKSKNSMSLFENIRKYFDSNFKTKSPTSNTKRCVGYSKYIRRDSKSYLRQNEKEQSCTYARGNREDKSHSVIKQQWFKNSSLQIFDWTRALSSRYARGFTALFSKQLGSEYCSNFKLFKSTLGVRERSTINKIFQLFPRFLSTRLQSIYRGKGILDIRWKKEIQTCPKEVPIYESVTNRPKSIQEMPIDFQRLNSIRVIDVEIIEYKGYVYNLEVEGAHTFIVNSVLTHNCSCFWEIAGLEERLTSEELYEDVPIESVKQLDPNALTVPSKAGTLAMQVAGAGLLVGGAFLLARSNLWNTAFSSMFNKNTYTFPLVPFDDVLENVVKYSDDVFDDSVTQAVTDTVINSLPDINLK